MIMDKLKNKLKTLLIKLTLKITNVTVRKIKKQNEE